MDIIFFLPYDDELKLVHVANIESENDARTFLHRAGFSDSPDASEYKPLIWSDGLVFNQMSMAMYGAAIKSYDKVRVYRDTVGRYRKFKREDSIYRVTS